MLKNIVEIQAEIQKLLVEKYDLGWDVSDEISVDILDIIEIMSK